MVLSLGRDSGMVIVYLAGPILVVGLVTGLVVSVFQAVTQIQEATLSFIPKLVAVFVVLALLGHWMLAQLLGFTITLFSNLTVYAR